MQTNRFFKPPEIKPIREIRYKKPEKVQLDNGAQVYILNSGQLDIVKLEIVIMAGRPLEHKPMAARCTTGMLKKGTARYSAAEINELLDFHGSHISLPASLDATHLVIFSLTKHLPSVLPVLLEMATRPSFPEDELQDYIGKMTQKMSVELTRPETVAYRSITEAIFGENHPYGYNSTKEGYQQITRSDLQSHFGTHFHGANMHIFLSGRLPQKQIKETLAKLSESIPAGEPSKKPVFPELPLPRISHVSMKQSHQISLRLGRKMFNRNHPDYPVFYLLNVILGGYFGSRLMREIREKRGFTYNIYSTIDTLIHDGYFYIASEIGPGYIKEARDAIFEELRKLREEPVGPEELEMVKNYTLGNLLLAADGPLRSSELVKTIYLENLGDDAFHHFVDEIHRTTSSDLQQMAVKYLDPGKMSLITVG